MQEKYWKITEELWFETYGGIEDNACGECEDGCAGTTPPRVVVRHLLVQSSSSSSRSSAPPPESLSLKCVDEVQSHLQLARKG